ncbi:MAG: hypothetical protein RR321_02655 [Acidaminococcaceae bacterium]
MSDNLTAVLNSIICFGIAYWVYRDSKKNEIKYANFWVVATALMPPVALAYYVYKLTAGTEVKLTKKQLLELEVKKRAADYKQKAMAVRAEMVAVQQEERAKNQKTVEEIEQIKAEKIALKKKRLQELAEERIAQQEENAKRMGMSADAGENLKISE